MENFEGVIDNITGILKNEGVEKVILFGSYAYGNPTNDSDIDLLVVKNIPENETRDFRIKIKKALWNELGKLNLSFDILVDNELRINKRILMGDLFYQEIYSKGRVLYV